MTLLVQCATILKAAGAKVQAWRADESSCEHFKEMLKDVSCGGGAKQLVLNYHMGALGQGDVGGHLSPLGGLAGDRALVMDVWPQTRECWAPVERLWSSIDTHQQQHQQQQHQPQQQQQHTQQQLHQLNQQSVHME